MVSGLVSVVLVVWSAATVPVSLAVYQFDSGLRNGGLIYPVLFLQPLELQFKSKHKLVRFLELNQSALN